MSFIGTAVGIGKKVIGAGKAAANSGGAADSDDSDKSATPLYDKIRKWSEKRTAQKNAGANDLSGVTAKLDSGEVEAKKGGKVKSEGLIKVHEGERILTKAQTRKYDEGPKTPAKKAPKKTVKKSAPRKRA